MANHKVEIKVDFLGPAQVANQWLGKLLRPIHVDAQQDGYHIHADFERVQATVILSLKALGDIEHPKHSVYTTAVGIMAVLLAMVNAIGMQTTMKGLPPVPDEDQS